MDYLKEFLYKNPQFKLNQFLETNILQLNEIIQGPGLYIIFCKSKQKLYIGQSENICRRVGDHWHMLNNNCHDCIQLQKNYNQIGSEDFLFYCLCVGPEWQDETIRKKLENNLVEKNSSFYNIGLIKKSKDIYQKAIKYKGIFYSSISEASNKLNISETSIRRKLKDLNEKNWQHIDSSEYTP